MMNLVKEIKDYIVETFLFGDEGRVGYDTPLIESGIVDSTGVMELVCFIEETYNTTIEDDELIHENFYSLNSINKLLNKKLNLITD